MNRLTSERFNGIKYGYWSNHKKDDLVQKLGLYEDIDPDPVEIWKRLVQWHFPPYTPPDGQRVLVVTENKKGLRNHMIGYYDARRKYWVCGMNNNVIAWTYLPEVTK